MKKLVIAEGQDPIEVDMTAEEVAEYLAANPDLPPVPRVVSSLEFMERFTQEERIALRRAAKESEALEDWLDLLRAAQSVDLDDPRTVGGLQAFAAEGLITAERAAEILG